MCVRSCYKITTGKVTKEMGRDSATKPRGSSQLDKHLSVCWDPGDGWAHGMGGREEAQQESGHAAHWRTGERLTGSCRKWSLQKAWEGGYVMLESLYVADVSGVAQHGGRTQAQEPDTPGWHCIFVFAPHLLWPYWLWPTLSWFLKWMDCSREFLSPFLF